MNIDTSIPVSTVSRSVPPITTSAWNPPAPVDLASYDTYENSFNKFDYWSETVNNRPICNILHVFKFKLLYRHWLSVV